MNPDGLSYLDIASGVVRGRVSEFLNGYWSPGYPALISIALLLFRPDRYHEFSLIHALNFTIFIFALAAFSFLFRYWSRAMAEHAGLGDDDDTRPVLTSFAFTTFLFFSLHFIGVRGVTPDLAVAGFVFLAAAICCRLTLPGPRWSHYAGLGLVLGLGYYVKSVMFPLGLMLLSILFVFRPRSTELSRRRLMLSAFVFLMVSAPLTVLLSVRSNRLTFGESGRLNYAWFANGLQWKNGTGAPEEHDSNTTPENPVPKLLTNPLTLDLRSPIGGTYPLWYDPSYWYSDPKVGFKWNKQIAGIRDTVLAYREMITDMMVFMSGAAVLLFLAVRGGRPGVLPRAIWWQIAWPLATCSMYALVHVEPRYAGAFITLLWLAVYGGAISRTSGQVAAAVCWTVMVGALLPITMDIAVKTSKQLFHPSVPEYQAAARGLRSVGLQDGDGLAVVGYAHNSYYAKCARLRVLAQIPDAHEFWRSSRTELKTLGERLASIGIRALVAWNRPDSTPSGDWKDLSVSDSSRLSVLVLSPPSTGPK